MLQGPGQRFDFHMSKTLCDLRSEPLKLGELSDTDIHETGLGRSLTLSSIIQILLELCKI